MVFADEEPKQIKMKNVDMSSDLALPNSVGRSARDKQLSFGDKSDNSKKEENLSSEPTEKKVTVKSSMTDHIENFEDFSASKSKKSSELKMSA